MSRLAAPAEPFTRFGELLAEAKAVGRERLPEPTAFALATVNAGGQAAVRIVLLKDFDERGFVFYTNHESRKAGDIFDNPRVGMCFHWQPMERQVRVEGIAEKVTDEEADAYFASRPRGSQVGAWASLQSRPIATPGDLEARVAEVEARYAGAEVPRPPHWSGFRIVPERVEFWHGQPSRLHVRQLFVRAGAGWRVETLYP